MRGGLFPGQEEALARRAALLRAEGRRQASRRIALVAAIGGLVGMAWGSLATLGLTAPAAPLALRRPAPREACAPPSRLDRARELAVGPLAPLLNAQVEFATALATADQIDDTLWVGVLRLSNAAVEGHAGARPELTRLLATLGKRADAPNPLRCLLALAAGRAE